MLGQAGPAGLPVTVWTLANAFLAIMLVPARSHAPVCRRDRPAKPPLTREGIITVAPSPSAGRGAALAQITQICPAGILTQVRPKPAQNGGYRVLPTVRL